MCMSACTSMLWRQEEGIGSLGTGITNNYEPPCGCWDVTWGPLEDHLLVTEPYPHLSKLYFLNLFSIVLVCLMNHVETKVHNLFCTLTRFLKSCVKCSFPRPHCMKSPHSSKVDLAFQCLWNTLYGVILGEPEHQIPPRSVIKVGSSIKGNSWPLNKFKWKKKHILDRHWFPYAAFSLFSQGHRRVFRLEHFKQALGFSVLYSVLPRCQLNGKLHMDGRWESDLQ